MIGCHLPDVKLNSLDDNPSELSSQYEVNNEVDGGIEDKREVIEAGHAEEPGRREEGGTTPENIETRESFTDCYHHLRRSSVMLNS